MRTGLGSGVDDDAEVERVQNKLIACTAALVVRAAKESEILACHAGAEEVTKDHVVRAMKRLSMHFMDEVTDEEVADIERVLSNDSDGDDDDEGVDPPQIPDRVDGEGGQCACGLCASAGRSEEAWECWSPNDPVLQWLKRGTQEVIDTHHEDAASSSDDDLSSVISMIEDDD
jgi:hypothetical protein